MGMSSYVLDCEEKFYDVVADAVKGAEDISEAYAVANENKALVANWSDAEVTECVDEFWNDFWSKYQ
jgi:hypothetical protein